MSFAIKYTKSDLQLSDASLFHAIIQVGKELEKRDTPLSRTLNKRLLANFNNYEKPEMTRMINNFQHFLIECVVGDKEGILDVEYVVENKLTNLKQIIMV